MTVAALGIAFYGIPFVIINTKEAIIPKEFIHLICYSQCKNWRAEIEILPAVISLTFFQIKSNDIIPSFWSLADFQNSAFSYLLEKNQPNTCYHATSSSFLNTVENGRTIIRYHQNQLMLPSCTTYGMGRGEAMVASA